MSGLNEREKGMDRKLQQDSDFRFKVEMRRNKLLGYWAAEQLGLDGEASKEYTASVVKADFEEAGDDDVVRKVKADFEAKSIGVDEEGIRSKIEEYNQQAAQEIMDGA